MQIFKTDGPYALVLKLTSSVTWASFNADFDQTEVKVMVAGATVITFSAPFQSNGVYTSIP